MTLAVLHMSI